MIWQTIEHVLRAGAEGSPQTNPIIARIERNSGHFCGRKWPLHAEDRMLSRALLSLLSRARSFELNRSVLLWVADRRGCGSIRVRGEGDGSPLDRLSNKRGVKSAAVFPCDFVERAVAKNVSVLYYCNRPSYQSCGVTCTYSLTFFYFLYFLLRQSFDRVSDPASL